MDWREQVEPLEVLTIDLNIHRSMKVLEFIYFEQFDNHLLNIII